MGSAFILSLLPGLVLLLVCSSSHGLELLGDDHTALRAFGSNFTLSSGMALVVRRERIAFLKHELGSAVMAGELLREPPRLRDWWDCSFFQYFHCGVASGVGGSASSAVA